MKKFIRSCEGCKVKFPHILLTPCIVNKKATGHLKMDLCPMCARELVKHIMGEDLFVETRRNAVLFGLGTTWLQRAN